MKNIASLLFLIVISQQIYCQRSADTVISNNPQNIRLKLYYFHITNRCNTCYSIEANIRKTLADYFKSKVDTGIIDLYILNCELPENKFIVKKYDAYGATLALTPYQNGYELKTEDLTGWAFQKANKPEIFISELKAKIDEFIGK